MTLFTSKEQIQELLQQADNHSETNELTSYLRERRAERQPFYLTLPELERILHWKLRKQYGRQEEIRTVNTEENIIAISRTAFSINHENNDIEIALKLKLLSTLSGVNIPVASAILTLCFPEQYSVIDVRNWRQIYPQQRAASTTKTTYSTKEYIAYLKQIRQWAKAFDVTPQEIDVAIWQSDFNQNKEKATVQK